jgi:outer membrane receptor protein involved in Fe transport
MGAALIPDAGAQVRLPQREQVEQTEARRLSLEDGSAQALGLRQQASDITATDDAFGVQSILKERIKEKPFLVYSETGVFYTDNAALLPTNEIDDTFLNTSLGLTWRRSLPKNVTAIISGRYGWFRYGRLSELDFQTLDIEASFVVDLPRRVEMLIGYGFTQFTSRQDLREFYSEHVLNLGFQRVFPIARAHYLIAGASARWSWADPGIAQRDRYSVYLGYHLRATERISVDLGYRYAFFDYRDGGTGRSDHNHSLSLSMRYDVTQWFNVGASLQGTWNRSSQEIFDYDALNLGAMIDLGMRF